MKQLPVWLSVGLCAAAPFAACRGAEPAPLPITLVEKGTFPKPHDVRFEATPEGKVAVLSWPGAQCDWMFPLDPSWGAIHLSGWMKVTGVPSQPEGWKTGRVAMMWVGADGKPVCPWPANYGAVGTTEWFELDRTYSIPTNAVKLSVSLCNLSTAGEVRFRDIALSVVRHRVNEPGNALPPQGAETDAESLRGAYTVETATRLRLSLNGLWRVRPSFAAEGAAFVPKEDDNWGWDKLPEVWRGNGREFPASDSLAPWVEDHPDLRATMRPDCAWYGRKLTFPAVPTGRRAKIGFEMVASFAKVFVDGRCAGEVAFPSGEVDITDFVAPGREQFVTLFVSAYPQGEMLNYNESTRATKERKTVKFKGVTGDVWLDLVPGGRRVLDAYAETSVERGTATFVAATAGLSAGEYAVTARVRALDGGESREFAGRCALNGAGELRLSVPWRDARLWDTHTPGNRYECRLTVADGAGKVVDEPVPFAFGFREVTLKGRDLLLNGTTIHLRALYNDTTSQIGPAAAKRNAVALCRNLQANGFNFIIAGNYSFNAGSVVYLKGLLEACDETGMLYSFTLPHFKDYAPLESPEMQGRYRDVTRKLIALARNHPSIITYATSHNAAGYLGAGNPLRIDGKYELPLGKPRPDNPWDPACNRPRARIARRIIGEIDPTRPCYHHESGNLDEFHTVNCYLNWSPVQERSDWLEHWATEGVKPLFFVEWGLPHVASWSSYRGPNFIWRTKGYMSIWSAEHAAAFRGDAAYEPTEAMRRMLANEERDWATGEPFSYRPGDCEAISNNYHGVQALFAADNWRSFRGWGITAMLPWDQGGFFKRVRHSPATWEGKRWRGLKQPGYAAPRATQWADPKEYAPTAIGRTMQRWNMPDCGWIAGDGCFTDKRHLFRPGETIRKTLMILNDRRVKQTVRWEVQSDRFVQRGETEIAAGGSARIPFAFAAGAAGEHEIRATFHFEGEVRQDDAFRYVSLAAAPTPRERVALFDPKGLTAANLKRLGVPFDAVAEVGAGKDTAGRTLVVGREALTAETLRNRLVPFARDGGTVVVFEQTKQTLEDIGFRVQTYGLRNVFPRYRRAGLEASQVEETLRDWAGESTLVEGHTPLKPVETSADCDTWAGFKHSRVWRNGNRGAVATIIPEKPTLGDWRALADGGFDLQFAPLLEWRVGEGAITFCQMDVTGRSVCDPAADDLVRRLVGMPREDAPRAVVVRERENKVSADGKRYYVADGAAQVPPEFFDRVKEGAVALLCGLDAAAVRRWCPVEVACEDVRKRMFSRIEDIPPELNGLSNGDWAWHGRMDFAAFTDSVRDGNEAIRVIRHGKGKLVFWQVPPWMIDDEKRPYLRTSKRRAEHMLSRLMGNLGFARETADGLYADKPLSTDDPYSYFHW